MLPVSRVIGHKEYAAGRKSDPTYSMDWRRRRVAAFKPRNQEDDALMAVSEADFNALDAKVDRLVAVLLDRDLDRTGVTADDTVQAAPARDLWRYADGNALVTRRAVEDLDDKVDALAAQVAKLVPPSA